MNIKTLKNILKDNGLLLQSGTSEDAESSIYSLLQDYADEKEDSEQIDFDELRDRSWEYSEIIYYSSAWSYLQDNNITDFEDAFANGLHGIEAIASHYLNTEIWEELDNIEQDAESGVYEKYEYEETASH